MSPYNKKLIALFVARDKHRRRAGVAGVPLPFWHRAGKLRSP